MVPIQREDECLGKRGVSARKECRGGEEVNRRGGRVSVLSTGFPI